MFTEKVLFFFRFFFEAQQYESFGHTFSHVENLLSNLTQKSKYIKPLYNQNNQMKVEVCMTLNAIKDYDEISGTFSI